MPKRKRIHRTLKRALRDMLLLVCVLNRRPGHIFNTHMPMTRISLRSCGPEVRFIRIIDSTLSILIFSTHRVLNLGEGKDDKSPAVKVR